MRIAQWTVWAFFFVLCVILLGASQLLLQKSGRPVSPAEGVWLAAGAAFAAVVASELPYLAGLIHRALTRTWRGQGIPVLDTDPGQLGRYELRTRLGEGASSIVYLGRGPKGRYAAVKVFRPAAGGGAFTARLRAEVAAQRRVRSRYVPVVLDESPYSASPWLATAFVPGPTLQQAIALHGAWTGARELAMLALGLSRALSAIHAEGLVHRDVKPSNVVLGTRGPMLIDFGIAAAVDATLSQAGGTPLYLAPEQAQPAVSVPGPAADVFSLGATLAYAATGRAPFGDSGQPALLVSAEPDLSGMADTGTSAHEIKALIAACLAKDPATRPSAAEVVALAAGIAGVRDVPAGWLPESTRQLARSMVTRPFGGRLPEGGAGSERLARVIRLVPPVIALVLGLLTLPGLSQDPKTPPGATPAPATATRSASPSATGSAGSTGTAGSPAPGPGTTPGASGQATSGNGGGTAGPGNGTEIGNGGGVQPTPSDTRTSPARTDPPPGEPSVLAEGGQTLGPGKPAMLMDYWGAGDPASDLVRGGTELFTQLGAYLALMPGTATPTFAQCYGASWTNMIPLTALTTGSQLCAYTQAGRHARIRVQGMAGDSIALSGYTWNIPKTTESGRKEENPGVRLGSDNPAVRFREWRSGDPSPDLGKDAAGLYTRLGSEITVHSGASQPTYQQCKAATGWSASVPASALREGTWLCARDDQQFYAWIKVRAVPAPGLDYFVLHGYTWSY
ncbi:serine/threonine-protein kinase [Longispora albida]|uniref:serine/threonine-protein kinase n=1 Tax=Longispora albida TaxID=203523 RepID=UPI0003A63329|nr:serine/threonine-protein kinase [Longispora albida]